MQKSITKKSLVCLVILILIGIGIQPAFGLKINTFNKNDSGIDDKSKYIIEIIREDEIIEQSVFLNELEAVELETLIEKIRNDLDLSISYEETIQTYYNAVDSFSKLGIFPKEISPNEIKELSTGENRELDKIRFRSKMGDGFENRLCLVSGYTSKTSSFGPIILGTLFFLIPAGIISVFIFEFIETFNLEERIIGKILAFLQGIFIALPADFLLFMTIMSIFCMQPLSIGSFLTFGTTEESFIPGEGPWHYPSDGWIHTIGLNGEKSYSGPFYGQLAKIWLIFSTFYSGITGFTGINIRRDESSTVFYLGFGLNVNIETTRPKNYNPSGIP
jgi:hypothetical protein